MVVALQLLIDHLGGFLNSHSLVLTFFPIKNKEVVQLNVIKSYSMMQIIHKVSANSAVAGGLIFRSQLDLNVRIILA